MEAPTYVLDTALPRSQQDSSDLPPSPSSSQVDDEAIPEEGPQGYRCSLCQDTWYTQRQGAWLHIRTVHKPKICFICGIPWARPYVFRAHLTNEHPHIDPDMILGKAPPPRRKSTIRKELLPQRQMISPPAVEQPEGQFCSVGSQPNASAWAPPAGTIITSVFPPAVSSVDYDLQHVYAEQTATMGEREYAHGSEFLNATDFLAMLQSTEERAEPMNNLDTHLQDGQFGLPPVLPGGSTATHSPFNPEMAPIPTLSPHGENYDPLVSEDPMIGPACYSPLSDPDINALFDAIFTDFTP